MIAQSKISLHPPKTAKLATGFRRALVTFCDFELNKFTTWGSWTPTHKTRNRKMCAFSHFTVPRSAVQRWGESLFFCTPQPCWHRWVFTNTSQKLTLPLKVKKKKNTQLVTVAAGLLKSAVLHSHDESEEGRNPKANTSHLISISESQSLF